MQNQHDDFFFYWIGIGGLLSFSVAFIFFLYEFIKCFVDKSSTTDDLWDSFLNLTGGSIAIGMCLPTLSLVSLPFMPFFALSYIKKKIHKQIIS